MAYVSLKDCLDIKVGDILLYKETELGETKHLVLKIHKQSSSQMTGLFCILNKFIIHENFWKTYHLQYTKKLDLI